MTAMTWLIFAMGLALLVGGAEILVRGASGLAQRAGIPPIVIGLTIVAFGTSAPEVAVSAGAALSGEGDIALGNVIGSNTFNVLIILGLSAVITPLVVTHRLVRVDVPLMIVVSTAAWLLCFNGLVSRAEGIGLLIFLILWTAALFYASRKEKSGAPQSETSDAASTSILLNIVLIVVGLGLLVVGARWLVESATAMARAVGVTDLVIGVTIVAAGTSLPELATSLLAALRGERDIAVGNVVGSNIFNILGVLGIAALVAPAGLAVKPGVLVLDLPVMLLAALACWPAFLTAHIVSRYEGAVFALAWIAYTVVLLFPSSESMLFMIGLEVILVAVGVLLVAAWVGLVGLDRGNSAREATEDARKD